MNIPTMFKLSIILLAFIMTASTDENDNVIKYDDKLILKPSQLAQLVLKERMKTGHHNTIPGIRHRDIDEPAVQDISDDIHIPATKIEETADDAETLMNRKVWSRWGKWGECSVSCGDGYIARQRACVGGRCASGEREEQRRPCRRTPCPYRNSETHDPD